MMRELMATLQDTPRLLRALADVGVDFLIVGGVAAIAHGATTFTRDLDVLVRFDLPNVERLLGALAAHAPRFALHPTHPPVDQPAAELATFKSVCLLTNLGRLDVLGRLPNGTFADLVDTADPMELAGVPCRVLGLEALIASKEMLGRDKDRLAVAELRAVRDRLAAAEKRGGSTLDEHDP